MNKPSSLYIHIPFCKAICDYCDFPKLQYFRDFAIKYLDQLQKEMDSYQVNDHLRTIYIGGGTPTCLDDDLFEKLLQMVFPYTKHIEEFTVEANPESLSLTKLKLMKQYGANRISIGVESTNDEILKAINRHHTFKDVQTAIKEARNLGFDNINVDLILGLPNVANELLSKDIVNILSLNPEHISCYSLTVHENTMFGIKHIQPVDDDISREQYDLVHKVLGENGFIHYEVSNWAKSGRESKHNLVYWNNEQYYGVGMGASGYIGNTRYTNTMSLTKYNSGQNTIESEVVDAESDKEYEIILNLRTIHGIFLSKWEEKYHEDFYEIHKELINKLVDDKLLVYNQEEKRIYPTYDGMMILDTILMQLLEE